MSTTVAGGWPPSPANDAGLRVQQSASYYIYYDTFDAKYHAASNGSAGVAGGNIVSGDAATTINNAITAAPVGSKVFIKNGTYPITTAITPKTGITIQGEHSSATILKATVNNVKIISMAASLPQNSVRVMNLGFDSGTATGVTGVDFNQTNNEKDQTTQNNLVYDTQFFHNFTNLIDLTGCEASLIDLAWADNVTCLAGDILAKTYNGDITVNRAIWPQPGGTSAALRVMGQQVKVFNSVINQIVIENQIANSAGSPNPNSVTYTASNQITIKDTFFANSQPSGVHKIVNNGNQTNTVNILALDNVDVGLANAASMFGASGTGSLTANYASFKNCFFKNLDASAVTWTKAPVGSVVALKQFAWDKSNQVTGTIAIGDPMTGGFGQFDFQPAPAGWGLTRTPAIPVGTGSGNARRNFYPRPVKIYQVGAVATHIIDAGPLGDTANPVDTLLGVDPTFVTLEPGEQIYYATTVPSSWKWYGL